MSHTCDIFTTKSVFSHDKLIDEIFPCVRSPTTPLPISDINSFTSQQLMIDPNGLCVLTDVMQPDNMHPELPTFWISGN